MSDSDSLNQQLGRIEGKLDSLCTTTSRAHTRIDSIEKDIRTIEKTLARYAAWITVIATIFSTGVGLAIKQLFGK